MATFFSVSRASSCLSRRFSSSSLSNSSSSGPFSTRLHCFLKPFHHEPLIHYKLVQNSFIQRPNLVPGRRIASHSSSGSSSNKLNDGRTKYSGDRNQDEDDDSDKVKEGFAKFELKSNNNWIDLYVPEPVRPYAHLARLDKPIGTWLFAWPCLWSITLTTPPGILPDFKMLALFGYGSIILRGIACTINDILDRDFDAKVERTKSRPLASGLVSPFQGFCFLGFQVLLYFGFLLQLNNYSCVLGALLLPLIFTYPLMKRLTYWPQAYLGFAFNWGALLGWAAVEESLAPAIVIPLYISGVFWTLVYDTIYAHQDKEDDLKVGVKSTALLFGDKTKTWVTGFAIACVGSLSFSGFNANIGWPFYASLLVASGHLAWQIGTVDLSSPADCSSKFVSNMWYGAIVFSGILFGKLAS